jgi:hypothetical protein
LCGLPSGQAVAAIECLEYKMVTHKIDVDTENRSVSIFRVRDGEECLLTRYDFDEILSSGFDKFSKQLGEDLVFDNKLLRALLRL